MLSDTFGSTAIDLLQEPKLPKGMFSIMNNHDESFINFYIAGLAFYVYFTEECTRYADLHEFVHTVTVRIPELCQLKKLFLKAADSLHIDSLNLDAICSNYQRARFDLVKRCKCNSHNILRDLLSAAVDSFCLVTVAETILLMSYFLGRLHMIVPLQPRRMGILNLYQNIKIRQGWYRTKDHPYLGLRGEPYCQGVDPDIIWDFGAINSRLRPNQGSRGPTKAHEALVRHFQFTWIFSLETQRLPCWVPIQLQQSVMGEYIVL